MNCLRYAVKTAGIPLESAVKCATKNPSIAVGLSADYGSIEAGKYADIVILDRDLNLVHVIKKGKVCEGLIN